MMSLVYAGKILQSSIKRSMLRSKMSIVIVLVITESMFMLMPISKSHMPINKRIIMKKWDISLPLNTLHLLMWKMKAKTDFNTSLHAYMHNPYITTSITRLLDQPYTSQMMSKCGNFARNMMDLQTLLILNLKTHLFRYIRIFLLMVNTEFFTIQEILILLSQLMELNNGLMISIGTSLKSGSRSMLTHKLLVMLKQD
jgi:hypothetical protein